MSPGIHWRPKITQRQLAPSLGKSNLRLITLLTCAITSGSSRYTVPGDHRTVCGEHVTVFVGPPWPLGSVAYGTMYLSTYLSACVRACVRACVNEGCSAFT